MARLLVKKPDISSNSDLQCQQKLEQALSEKDKALIHAIQYGLPLISRPYAEIGQQIGMSESEVITRLSELLADGTIKRLGIVVRHRKLGYRSNAMVVWDVPDSEVAWLGNCLKQFDFITLCYRRPRRLPHWPYNLFCMIHGRARETVIEQMEWLVNHCHLEHIPHKILFSRRCFKQRGAIYTPR